MQRLYKRDVTGKLRVWWIEVSEDGAAYRTHAGINDGAIVTADWTYVSGNQQRPDPVDQCKFEVESLYAYKLARTYHDTIEGAGSGAKFFEPMLAYELDRKRLSLNDLRQEGHCPVLLYIQPKLDGMRCIIRAEGMFSRTGRAVISAPHIFRALQPFFAENPDAILDGEIYNHRLKYDFSKIMSLAKKSKPTEANLRESERMLEYHIYDFPGLPNVGYDIRREAIASAIKMCSDAMPFGGKCPLVPVETVPIASWEEWDEKHAEWLADGYEGSMGRSPNTGYEQKRTHALVKRKDFDTCEFDVSAVESGDGNWGGACKRVFFWLPRTEPSMRTPENAKETAYTFKATPVGSYDFLRNVLEGELPLKATVRYLGWTTTDNPKPRHGTVKQFYWDERDD